MERGDRRHIVDLNCWHLGSDASGTAVDSPSPLVAVLAGGALAFIAFALMGGFIVLALVCAEGVR